MLQGASPSRWSRTADGDERGDEGNGMDGPATDGGRFGVHARGVRLLLAAGLVGALLPLGGGAGATGSEVTAVAPEATTVEALAAVELPPLLGQSEVAVYVPTTGHTLAGVMLDYWRATGGAEVYGDPISEPFAATNGYYSQAFERGVFQFRPDVLHTVEPIVRLMPIGQTALNDRVGTFRVDRRRSGGGGDRRSAAWSRVDADGKMAAQTVDEGGRFVEATGHTIGGPFLDWYGRHEGEFFLGNPLGEPVEERGRIVQWFEGGLLIEEEGVARLAPLARELAPRLGIDTAAVDRGELSEYDEDLFRMADNPNPAGDLDAPGPKRIEVDLSEQRLWAYQGETLISTSLVTTGLAPNDTEQGQFRVRYKKPVEDMRGVTDAEGNVIWVAGDLTTEPFGIPYGVADVPHVMYFNLDAEALHGAYWRDVFGEPGSHGCVNLPMPLAEFLYGWAPLGTPVWVHE